MWRDTREGECEAVTEDIANWEKIIRRTDERNYHVFYELLEGMSKEQKDKYGLMSADKYFYLNQGGQIKIDGKNDQDDFETMQSALQVLSFSTEECETIYKILASILHLGNVYFHRKQVCYCFYLLAFSAMNHTE